MVKKSMKSRKNSQTKGKAKYTCKYCRKSLMSKENLYEHLKKWHKMLKPKTKRTLRKDYDKE